MFQIHKNPVIKDKMIIQQKTNKIKENTLLFVLDKGINVIRIS